MEIEELATHALTFFQTKVRPAQGADPGDRYYTLTNRYPVWLYDLVHTAHENMLPDDYKWQYVSDTLDALSEGQDPEDGWTEIEADVYNADLLKWLQSGGERTGFVDEAIREFGFNQESGIMGAIMMGQVQEKQQVWKAVVSGLQERLDAIEAEEPEEFAQYGKGKGRKDWDPRRS